MAHIVQCLSDNAFARDIAEELQASFMEYLKSPAELHVEEHRLHDLALWLRTLADRVYSHEQKLSAMLPEALAVCPEGPHSTLMEVLQAAGLMARPAQADLMIISLTLSWYAPALYPVECVFIHAHVNATTLAADAS